MEDKGLYNESELTWHTMIQPEYNLLSITSPDVTSLSGIQGIKATRATTGNLFCFYYCIIFLYLTSLWMEPLSRVKSFLQKQNIFSYHSHITQQEPSGNVQGTLEYCSDVWSSNTKWEIWKVMSTIMSPANNHSTWRYWRSFFGGLFFEVWTTEKFQGKLHKTAQTTAKIDFDWSMLNKQANEYRPSIILLIKPGAGNGLPFSLSEQTDTSSRTSKPPGWERGSLYLHANAVVH